MNPEMSQRLIEKTASYMRQKFAEESSGHDWWHIYRVWKMAQTLCNEEKDADRTIVELAALLHDIADWKFHNGDETAGPKAARQWLERQKVDEGIIDQVSDIIKNMSFKGAATKTATLSLEGQIVQDADRLDAIGAIGIARAFAYGGHANRLLYDPDIKAEKHQTAEAYKSNQSSTINHFYEKLLLLKDRMNTPSARRIAEHRHQIMEEFLTEFYDEWDGKK
jgi:uncharacterized protein